jgi:hypothetical protein
MRCLSLVPVAALVLCCGAALAAPAFTTTLTSLDAGGSALAVEIVDASTGDASALPADSASLDAPRLVERHTPISRGKRLGLTTAGDVDETPLAPLAPRNCQSTVTHSSFGFGTGQVVVQAGFVETEIAAVSYSIPASQFPLRVDLMEVFVATSNATVQTTTEWSILVWDGPPNTGTLVAEYSSDDVILPHIVAGPGTVGVNVQVSVDPGDPNQIILTNAGGTGTISFGFRIDEHNAQTGTGCFPAPPANQNCFPTTDVGGLATQTGNWIFAFNCGPGGCPSGWRQFAGLGLCRPSGDWNMRLTYTSLSCNPGVGACCFASGTCTETTSPDCSAQGGTFKGEGTTCATTTCPIAPQACCFPATGGCLNLTPANCTLAGGIPGGVGTACGGSFVCFPEGACCLPDGSCQDGLSPSECAALNGTFEGNNTTCATTTCPEPTGSCCFATGGCLDLTQGDCGVTGGTWGGAGSACANGCDSSCPADLTGDGQVDSGDLAAFITAFLAQDPLADLTGDGQVDSGDLAQFITLFLAGC